MDPIDNTHTWPQRLKHKIIFINDEDRPEKAKHKNIVFKKARP